MTEITRQTEIYIAQKQAQYKQQQEMQSQGGETKRGNPTDLKQPTILREQQVSNDDVIFDSKGKAIILSEHSDFASLGEATRNL